MTIDPKAHHFLAGLAQQARYVHDFAKAGHQQEAAEHAAAIERLLAAWRIASGEDRTGAIHTHFGLSYANYLVVPRTLLQSMPDEWQARLVRLLNEMDDAFGHVPKAKDYQVTAGQWMQVNDMTDCQAYTAGVIVEGDGPDGPGPETRYHRASDGAELNATDEAFLPSKDPVPHYNRGRTRIAPRLDRTEVPA